MKAKSEKGVDRRIQKTKKYLTEALINLILEKGYENVTVQDIIDKANVGRSTFYIHYESKEQLLLDGHNNLNIKIFPDEESCNGKQSKDVQHTEISFENVFNHIAANPNLTQAMLGKKSGNIMIEFYKNTVAYHIQKKVKSRFGNHKAELQILRYLADAAASAVVSLLISWLQDGMSFPASEMALRCQNIVAAIFEKSSLQHHVVIGGQKDE